MKFREKFIREYKKVYDAFGRLVGRQVTKKRLGKVPRKPVPTSRAALVAKQKKARPFAWSQRAQDKARARREMESKGH